MKNELSILIPTYNDICVDLVKALARQCEAVKDLRYEILVADDGSTDVESKNQNLSINNLYRCKYILREYNVGRSCIRNWLALQARYEWLLFIDSHMSVCKDDFITTYLKEDEDEFEYDYEDVFYGSYVVKGDERQLKGNLRYLYEKNAEHIHSIEQREMFPYQDFHTSNFLISRKLFVSNPLDVRFRNYGYEDVLYGKQLKEKGILIFHIDNPLAFDRFEDNAHFVAKTEEGLRSLYCFKDELKGYARMLDAVEKIKRYHLMSLLMWIYKKRKGSWRKKLCGNSPSLLVFKAYKLGYFCSLSEKPQMSRQSSND